MRRQMEDKTGRQDGAELRDVRIKCLAVKKSCQLEVLSGRNSLFNYQHPEIFCINSKLRAAFNFMLLSVTSDNVVIIMIWKSGSP